jgi:hypothetical protein
MRLFLAASLLLFACSRSAEGSPAQTAPSAPATKLHAEIVPVIGGLYPVAKADLAGIPASTTLVLRVTNDGDAPIVLRTGGDDEGFEITARGAGLVSVKSTAPCPEFWAFGKKNAIAAHDHLDVPLRVLASGARCNQTSLYLTTPGNYELDVSLRAHIHESAGVMNKGERGTEIVLHAPKITLGAG